MVTSNDGLFTGWRMQWEASECTRSVKHTLVNKNALCRPKQLQKIFRIRVRVVGKIRQSFLVIEILSDHLSSRRVNSAGPGDQICLLWPRYECHWWMATPWQILRQIVSKWSKLDQHVPNIDRSRSIRLESKSGCQCVTRLPRNQTQWLLNGSRGSDLKTLLNSILV